MPNRTVPFNKEIKDLNLQKRIERRCFPLLYFARSIDNLTPARLSVVVETEAGNLPHGVLYY